MTQQEYYQFECGCKALIIGPPKNKFNIPRLKFDWYNLPYCAKTWEFLHTGKTEGVFQVESQLGQTWTKKILPNNIDELGAVSALIRPGCVSKNSKILYQISIRKNGNYRFHTINIEKLYKNKHKYKTLISLNEQNGKLEKNNLIDVIYTGKKKIYKINIKTNKRYYKTCRYNLECTDDHKLLTPNGWKALKDIKHKERIAIVQNNSKRQRKTINFPGAKYFRSICYKNYQYRCIFCNWSEASLDVNHIEGNRHTNNHYDNLCFMCPNHHKMYSENKISKNEVITEKNKYLLPQFDDVIWAEFLNYEFLKEEDVYDISMTGPNHNFISNNVIVHNCLHSIVDGKNLTAHYADRKNKREEITSFHPAVDECLKNTYNVMCYQEDAIRLAREIAGFTLEEADELRKGIGKKLASEIARLKILFIDKAEKLGVVTKEEAIKVFDWIEQSQRYLFVKSHSASYAAIGYQTAYAKYHSSIMFYCNWLKDSIEQADGEDDVKKLIAESQTFGYKTNTPNILSMRENFHTDGEQLYFGLINIKGVGKSVVDKIKEIVSVIEKPIQDWSWIELLIHFYNVNSKAMIGLIMSGAFDYMKMPRFKMRYEYEQFQTLNEKEVAWLKKYPNIEKIQVIDAIKLCSQSGDLFNNRNKKRLVTILNVIKILEKPTYELVDKPAKIIAAERELLGVALTYTVRDSIDIGDTNCTCEEFSNGINLDKYILGVEINNVKSYTIKNGKQTGKNMYYVEITDGTSTISCTVFPKEFEEYGPLITIGNKVIIYGTKDKQRGSLILNKAKQA